MHDELLRKALESKKTVSRKAKSMQSSGAASKNNSPAGSRNGSRTVSRNVSDDEGELSDTTNFSNNSIDDMLYEKPEEPGAWVENLHNRVEQVIDRKRSSAQGREDCLNGFSHILMAHYAQKEIRGKTGELVPAILKSVKAGQTEKETVLALKALTLVLVTEPSDHIYDAIVSPIKITISDSEYINAKVAAVHALGAATFYGGASEDETQSIMDFLVEIIESDGEVIEAGDNGAVVTAALEEWGFLATVLEDMSETSTEPIEAMIEQLESSDVGVQIASGENIALLYEKSYSDREADDDPPSENEDQDSDDEDADDKTQVKRYSPYRRTDQLSHTLSELATASSRRVSKKDRKSLHSNFSDILNSVEHPTRGPRYSNALNAETGERYGSRMTVKVGGKSQMIIDKWWKLHRLKALRRILQGGFLVHYKDNSVVFETLPVIVLGGGGGADLGHGDVGEVEDEDEDYYSRKKGRGR